MATANAHGRVHLPAEDIVTFGDVSRGVVQTHLLHESTAPDAIARDQQAAVEWAWYAKGARSWEAISALTDLPVWTVRRRLHECGLGPPVPFPKKEVNNPGRNGLPAGFVRPAAGAAR